MDALRRAAFTSIGRACGFAGLAILCVMVGLSYDPAAAAASGGILSMLVVAVLLLKARWASTGDVRRTEMWLLLDKAQQPPAAAAQWAGATALREACLWFARYAAGVSAGLWALTLLLRATLPE